MDALPLLLVILAACIHATWNLLAKRAAAAGAAFVLAYTVVSTLFYLPWLIWLLAKGAQPWSMAIAACIVLGGALHLVYSLFLQRGYQVADLSVVYPVARGTGPTLSTLSAFVLLGEQPNVTGVSGAIITIIGILLICTQGSWATFTTPTAQKGVRWGAAAGAMIAGYTVVDAYGVKFLGIHPIVLIWCSHFIRLSLIGPWALGHRTAALGAMKGRWRLAIGVGILSPLSYVLVLIALRIGAPLSLVAPAREMSMMVGVLFGLFILREPVGPWRLCGCAVTILGVVLLAQS